MNFSESKILFLLLLPFTWLYRFIVFIRNKFYDRGLFKSHRLDCTVICVGNITVGGTGKTPVVEYLAKLLREQFGRKVVILSRGYRRESTGTVIVTDGASIKVSPRQAGDEPFLLAKRLSSIPVVVDENRVRGGHEIIRRFCPDVILLDDGFQHRRLERDVNIAVINSKAGFGNGQLLPAGPLREPVSALKRANLIWFNQATPANRNRKLNLKIAQFSKCPQIYSDYVITGIATIPAREHFPTRLFKHKNIFAFCGIANPERFKESLQALDVASVELMAFPDHHQFSDVDLNNIQQRITKINPDFVVTTEKDVIRLPEKIQFDRKLFCLMMQLIVNNEDLLKKYLFENIA